LVFWAPYSRGRIFEPSTLANAGVVFPLRTKLPRIPNTDRHPTSERPSGKTDPGGSPRGKANESSRPSRMSPLNGTTCLKMNQEGGRWRPHTTQSQCGLATYGVHELGPSVRKPPPEASPSVYTASSANAQRDKSGARPRGTRPVCGCCMSCGRASW
jgi:hypothetical protein